MTTEKNNRDIPPLPGGGSWTFDEQAWDWISNDPAPAEQVDATAPPSEQPTASTAEE